MAMRADAVRIGASEEVEAEARDSDPEQKRHARAARDGLSAAHADLALAVEKMKAAAGSQG